MSRTPSSGETLTSVIVVFVVACVLWVFFSIPYGFLPGEERPLTPEEIIKTYKQVGHQADFIKKISQELKLQKNVYLILVPTKDLPTKGVLIPDESAYYILADEPFFLGLSDIEQKALVGHEMGHIIFTCPNITFIVSCQTGADLFAAMRTSPEAVLSLLEKLFADSFNPTDPLKVHPEYKARIDQLKQLQGKVILPNH